MVVAETENGPCYLTLRGNLLTTTVCTLNSFRSMKAAKPSGPKAAGIAVAPVAKVPR